MTDIRRAIRDLAEQVPVPDGPPPSELVRRFHKRRRRRMSLGAAGIITVALAVALLVLLLPSGTGHSRRAAIKPAPLSLTMALAAGRRVLVASAGPPVGSMGVLGPRQLWVLDGDGLFLTSDGGSTWERMVAPSAGDPLADYYAIDFLSLRAGWVVASLQNSLQVDRTMDAGSTWEVAALPTALFPRGWQGADVYFANQSDGWVVVQPYLPPGHRVTSVVLSSTDGGASWNVADSQAPVISAIFSTATVGWGLGADGASLYRTTNAGVSWKPVTLPKPRQDVRATTSGWRALTLPRFFGSHGVLLAVPNSGDAVTEITADGGRTWRAQRTPFTGEPAYQRSEQPGPQPRCPDCVPAGDEPFAAPTVAHWIYWGGGRLYSTSSSGRSWTSLQPNVSFPGLGTTLGRVGVANEGPSDPLQFSSPQDGWALVSTNSSPTPQSVLLFTSDGGASFTAVRSPSGNLPNSHSSG